MVLAVALVTVVVLVVGSLAAWATWSAVHGDDGPNASPPSPSGNAPVQKHPSELARFYDQKLDWKRCGTDECAHLVVPLDRGSYHVRSDHPNGSACMMPVIELLGDGE